MPFFKIYQFLVPLLLLPISYFLWYDRAGQTHLLPLFAVGVPVVFAYVIPAAGTNWLKLWAFNTNLKWGNMRFYHGFVFGPASSLILLLCMESPETPLTFWSLLRAGFVGGSVFAFWNWYYDMQAIRSGFLIVYNRAYHEQRGPAEIAARYAHVYFGSFGFVYSIAVRVFESSAARVIEAGLFWPFFLVTCLVACVFSVGCYMLYSWASTGESGLRSYALKDG